jgi:hypothetical protein
MPEPDRGARGSSKIFAPVILSGLLIVGVVRYATENSASSVTRTPTSIVRDQGKPTTKEVVAGEGAVSTKSSPAPSTPKLEAPQGERAKVPSDNHESTLNPLSTRFIGEGSFFGCKSRETFDRIGSFAVSGDRAAFARLLSGSLSAGECIAWQKDTKVFVDEGGFSSSCLRKQGETSCYWTINEAIRRNSG